MLPKAPRLPCRLWHSRARGAVYLLCLWLAGIPLTLAAETITSARFTEPTTRYAHGVLGDTVEYGALQITLSARTRTVRLPADRVFEDLTPRLVDVDLDGKPEVIVVESHAQTGAQLAIYDANGKKIAATPHIGTRFRWLAPVGSADLDRDGNIEIAYVDRPHLAKTLRIWRFSDGRLVEIASFPDLTNHKIGEDFISGGLRECGDLDELILASGNWSRIIGVSYQNGWTKRDLGTFTGTQSLTNALTC